MLARLTFALSLLHLGCGSEVTTIDGANGSTSNGGEGGAPAAQCADGVATSSPTGVHFVLVELEQPIATQLQLFMALRSDGSGAFRGRLTNADRNPALACTPACAPDVEVCSPSLGCVQPSREAASAEEYGEWVPNDAAPDGFTSPFEACVDGDRLTTGPFEIAVSSPTVTIVDATMRIDLPASGGPRGTGTFAAAELLLGTSPSGAVSGTVASYALPESEVPDGVPMP
jgi:hypothetical protein